MRKVKLIAGSALAAVALAVGGFIAGATWQDEPEQEPAAVCETVGGQEDGALVGCDFRDGKWWAGAPGDARS